MLFWLSRRFTKSVAISKVNFSISADGDVAGTSDNNSVIAWSNTCGAVVVVIVAILGTSSGSFDFGGTFPSLMASFTSVTNWSEFSLWNCCASSLKWNRICREVSVIFLKHSTKSLTTSVSSCRIALSISVSVGLNASGVAISSLSIRPWP